MMTALFNRKKTVCFVLMSFILATLAIPKSMAKNKSELTIPDHIVINQHGEKVSFYSDLIKDKTVVINFIFTQCKMVCPLLGYHFGRLRDKLGDKAGKEVHLISVSIDPLNDSPQKLKKWSSSFNSGEGWTQVTGDKATVDEIVKALKSFSPDISDHSTMVLMGRESESDWKRVDGLSSSEILFSALSKWL